MGTRGRHEEEGSLIGGKMQKTQGARARHFFRHARALCIIVMLPLSGNAQISGYASTSLSVHSNPLYNSTTSSDRLSEAYLELNYADETEARTWTFGYLGALVLFNDFAPRNYYEHRVRVEYGRDSLKLSGLVGARHDRGEYAEFDNVHFSLRAANSWGAGASHIGLSDVFLVRSYSFVHELDNLSNETRVVLTTGKPETVSGHIGATFGVKYFTTNAIDTASFAVVQSTGKGNQGRGRGQGNAGARTSASIKKQAILVSSGAAHAVQVAPEAGMAKGWTEGEVRATVLLRINPGSDTRLLSNVGGNSILASDIYNDHFTYGGPEFSLVFRQEFSPAIRVSLEGELQRRKYLSPAFDIAGTVTDPTRVDLRGSLQTSFTRPFALGDDVSLEVALQIAILRNQSNDMFNDYGAAAAGVSIGISF